jgi:uncharacterized protein YifN (PemK superfamily)
MTNTAKKLDNTNVNPIAEAELLKHQKVIDKGVNSTRDGIFTICAELAKVKKKYDKEGLDQLNLPFARQNIQKHVKIGENDIILKNKDVMPLSWGTLYELTRLEVITLQRHIKDGKIKPEMTREEANNLVREETNLNNKNNDVVPLKEMIGEKKKMFVIYVEENSEKEIYNQLQGYVLDDELKGVFVHDVYSERLQKEQEGKLEKAKGEAIKFCWNILKEIARHYQTKHDNKWLVDNYPELHSFLFKDYKLASLKKVSNPSELIDPLLEEHLESYGKYLPFTYLDKFETFCDEAGLTVDELKEV